MFRILFFAMLGLSAIVLNGQTYFERYYDSGIDEFGLGIADFGNGNIAISGHGVAAGGRSQGYYMLANGVGTPSFRYLNTSLRNSLSVLTEVRGGQAILGGYITPNSNRDDWLVFTLNAAGNATPVVSLGRPSPDEELWGLVNTPDGGFAGCGAFGTDNIGMVMQFDAAGNERWRNGITSSNSSKTIFFSLLASEADLLVTGVKDEGNRNWSPIIVKLQNNGTLAWSFEYNLPAGQYIASSTVPMARMTNGDLLFAYITLDGDGQSVLLLKLNADGALIWSRKIQAEGELGTLDLLDIGNGRFILGGYHRPSANTSAGLLLCLDEEGNIDWAKKYAQDNRTEIRRLAFRADGNGLLAVGSGFPCGSDGRDIYLLSVDLDGEGLPGDCGPVELVYSVVDQPITRMATGRAGSFNISTTPAAAFRAPAAGDLMEPACLDLDLDADDSSGALANDYRFNLGCLEAPVPISDADFGFDGSLAGLDSLVITLTDGNALDSLFLLAGSPVVDTDNSPGRIALAGLRELSGPEIQRLIEAIRYLAASGEPAQRHIEIMAFTDCGTQTLAEAVFSLTDEEQLSVSLGNDASLCAGTSLLLDARTQGASAYLWSTGADTSVIFVDAPGDYAVTVTSSCGTMVADTISLSLASNELVVLDTTSAFSLCLGDSITLEAFTEGATSYRWSDGLTSSRRSVSQPGELTVLIFNACDTVGLAYEISVTNCCELYIPNVFSPNGDGINDSFKVFTSLQGCNAVNNAMLVIYDRWGGEVFAGEALQEGWDGLITGEPANAGAYAYVFSYSLGGETVQEAGSLMLIR